MAGSAAPVGPGCDSAILTRSAAQERSSILVSSIRVVTDTHSTVTASGTFPVPDRGRLGVAVSPGSASAGVSSFYGAAGRLPATSCWCPSSRRNSHRCSRAILPLFLSPILDSSSFRQAVRGCLYDLQQLTERLPTGVFPLARVGPLADPTLAGIIADPWFVGRAGNTSTLSEDTS